MIDTIKKAVAKNEPKRSSVITPLLKATPGNTSPDKTRKITIPIASTSAPNAIALYNRLPLPFSFFIASITGIASPTTPRTAVTRSGVENRFCHLLHIFS